MNSVYECNLYDEGTFRRVSLWLPDYEDKIMTKWELYSKTNHKFPETLVLSNIPYKALCALEGRSRDGRSGVVLEKIEEFHGMKVVRLDRWDEEIIEVG